MKRVAKAFYKIAKSTLPLHVRKLILLDLARDVGVSKISFDGQYGEILGYVNDAMIFRKYALEGVWSAGTVEAIRAFFEKVGGGTYFDIGANIGLTTIPVASNSRVACYAFEPEPNNYFALQQNVLKNCRFGNVETFNLALFDRSTQLQFELARGNFGDHRVHMDAGKELPDGFDEALRSIITVKAERLENLFSDRSLLSPICTKIDTQGAEHQVYLGGRSILSKSEMLICEFWPYALRRAGGDPDALLEMFGQDFATATLQFDEHKFKGSEVMPIRTTLDRIRVLTERSGPFDWVDLVLFK